MIRSKLGLLGLCAMVLGVMAFGAGSAQGEATANWLILTSGGVNKTGAQLPAQVTGEIENKDGSLLTKVLGLTVRILCESMALQEAKLEKEGSLTKGSRAVFSGCETFINNVLSEVCTPSSSGTTSGVILTGKFKGLAVLIGGAKRVRVEPEVAGQPFGTITFASEECVLPSIPIFGVLYVKDCKSELAFSEHLEVHLVEEDTVNSKLWAISHTVEHLATSLDGSALMFLTGTDKGLKWGGDV